jgi:DNA replication protein DnaD
MEQGWIKLHRKLIDDPIWLNSTSSQKVVLITLMLMANHAERKWEYDGRPYTCMPGQMITSLESIKNKCGDGITKQQVRDSLKRFRKMNFISEKTTQLNRLITINNWDVYQNQNYQDNIETTQSQHSGNTLTTPNNNDKNVKNEKKCSSSSKFLSFDEMEVQRVREKTLKIMKELEDEYADKV